MTLLTIWLIGVVLVGTFLYLESRNDTVFRLYFTPLGQAGIILAFAAFWFIAIPFGIAMFIIRGSV